MDFAILYILALLKAFSLLKKPDYKTVEGAIYTGEGNWVVTRAADIVVLVAYTGTQVWTTNSHFIPI